MCKKQQFCLSDKLGMWGNTLFPLSYFIVYSLTFMPWTKWEACALTLSCSDCKLSKTRRILSNTVTCETRSPEPAESPRSEFWKPAGPTQPCLGCRPGSSVRSRQARRCRPHTLRKGEWKWVAVGSLPGPRWDSGGRQEHEQTLHGVLPRKGQKPGEFRWGKQYFRLSAMVEKKREKLTNPSRVPPCLGEPLHPRAAPFFCDSLRVRDRNRAG